MGHSLQRANEHQDREQSVSVVSKAVKPTITRITSRDLFQQMRELEIDHGGRIYKLRLTQLNKLILTA
ncbi:hemin uptake protein HemP [Glaciimonas sp. Gout2]|uniref:hemin uptake protein HemP n=1 Tax=unclassified Glaciimonas TaxID=2644401 RepID=UPI002AB518B7|nr:MULTISPECIES: hemin uptake protein HemP [unclassified Glaciimonas]MDY7545608.1 hemin uptake protein HemP [Glaciimonas sp. CA11.2]MEB0012706.1 hemin uptake protein HemP [Glaciimonas sp. Cout2]MEB0082185.1 hemin uptake protein HemP [Glaciimonas sp. Gout2]